MAAFISGKNAQFIFFQDSNRVVLDVRTWDVGPNGEAVADGVNGEDRDRLQFIINFFEINCECFLQGVEPIRAMLANQAENDLNVEPLEKGIGLIIQPNDGTQAAFEAGEVTTDAWKWNSPGRVDRGTLNIPLRSRTFEEVPTL